MSVNLKYLDDTHQISTMNLRYSNSENKKKPKYILRLWFYKNTIF